LIADGGLYPKIELKRADHIDFLLQWVEFTIDDSDSTTIPIKAAGQSLTDFSTQRIGTQTPYWISPFTADTNSQGFAEYTGDKIFFRDDGTTYGPGSVGPMTLYRNQIDSDSVSYSDIDTQIAFNLYNQI